jgi:hypothetical protein
LPDSRTVDGVVFEEVSSMIEEVAKEVSIYLLQGDRGGKRWDFECGWSVGERVVDRWFINDLHGVGVEMELEPFGDAIAFCVSIFECFGTICNWTTALVRDKRWNL